MNKRTLVSLTVMLGMLLGVFIMTSAQGGSSDSRKVTVTLVRWPYT